MPQPGARPTPGPPPVAVAGRPLRPGGRGAADGPVQPTRVQIDVFELRCQSDRLAKLNLARLTKDNPAGSAVLERLGTLGSVRLLARIDNTTDLANESALTRTAQVPVVQNVVVPTSGPAEPSVDYRSAGLTMTLSGSWQDEEPDHAAIRCGLELFGIAASSIEIASDTPMPAFVKISINRNLVARSGQAVWTLSNNLPASEDAKGMTSAAIVRMVFTRLAPPAEPESADDQETEPSPPDERARTVKLQIDAFQLTCTNDRLARLNLDDIAKDDPADSIVLSRLRESGEARLLSRVQNTFDMSAQNRLTHGASVPIVQDRVAASDGTMVPSIAYNDVAFSAGISGRWLAADAPWAVARVEINASTVAQSRVKRASGIFLPTFDKFELRQRVKTPSGKPVWSMSSSLPDSTDGGRTNVVVLRVRPIWLPRPAPAEVNEEEAAEASPRSEKPQAAKLWVELFDLTCSQEQLASLDLDRITADEPTADAVLEQLGKLGQARLVARLDETIDLRRESSLSHRIQTPTVKDLVVEQGSAKPRISYRDVGLKAVLSGRWLPGADSWAELNCKLDMSMDAQSHVKLPSGVVVPTFLNFSMEQKQLLESGKSAWVISNRLPQADDPNGTVNVKLLRLKTSREDKPVER